MKRLNVSMIALVLGVAPALAQQKIYNLQVTESDLAVLSKYLGKAPYEEIVPILQRLGAQVQQQVQVQQTEQLAPVAPQPKQGLQSSSPQLVAPALSGMEADLKARGKVRPSIPADYGKSASQETANTSDR